MGTLLTFLLVLFLLTFLVALLLGCALIEALKIVCAVLVSLLRFAGSVVCWLAAIPFRMVRRVGLTRSGRERRGSRRTCRAEPVFARPVPYRREMDRIFRRIDSLETILSRGERRDGPGRARF